jgi:hypothetical protein
MLFVDGNAMNAVMHVVGEGLNWAIIEVLIK